MKRAVDLFCGGGGTSQGAESTGGVQVVLAVNHWNKAVSTHSANFPHCKHVNSRLDEVSPSEVSGVDLLFASPECTHHSRARGGKPTSDQQRSGAWQIMPWIEHHRPPWIVIENVVEFKDWGPVGSDGRPLSTRKGAMFDSWLMAIRAMNYRVDHQELNAADFGAATSRNRLFVIARKGGRNPIFPEPTHSKKTGGELPGMGLKPWRAAAEVIDWSIPCPSIFGRARPLADKTLLRIEAGLRRFVGPFVAQWDNQSGQPGVRGVDSPLYTMTTKASMGLVLPFQVVFRNNMHSAGVDETVSTITAGGGHHGIALPFLADVNHGDSGHLNGRSHSLESPLGTLTGKNGRAVVTPFMCGCGGRAGQSPPRSTDGPMGTITTKADCCLAVPFQYQLIGRGAGKSRSIDSSVPTIVATRENHGVCIPWLSHYYGTNNQSPVGEPLDTITTKERHSLCLALCRGPEDWPIPQTAAMVKLQATMRELGVCDIGFRMLCNPELALAQGFPSTYIFHGTKSEVTRQIGNSVSPYNAKAFTETILSV